LLKINKIIARACAHDLPKRYFSVEQLLNDLAFI